MAKRKTAEQEQLPAEPDVFDEQIAARQAEAAKHQGADAGEKTESGGFAEQVKREYPKVPDPYSIARDYAAGVELLENRQLRRMEIKFDEKPGPEVLEFLKQEHGYRWDRPVEAWVRGYNRDTAYQVRVKAEEAFQEVDKMVRKAKGLGEEQAR